MFTGIVEELGTVRRIVPGSKSIVITIGCKEIMEDVKLGDSIAVNGICLTVTRMGGDEFSADVMPETMRRTNLGKLTVSGRVNLERALRLSDRLGGHLVSGHIDGAGILVKKQQEDNAIWLTVEAPESILKYIIHKGSVALDGISLTVAELGSTFFKVSLIPLTAGFTTLGQKEPGAEINIECDQVAKYIERFAVFQDATEKGRSGITLEFLKENGF